MSGRRILVADDEPKMRRVLELMLCDLGHQVDTVADGAEALEWLASHDADLVITDQRMPGVDGIELLQRLRARGDETPVIMVTAYGNVDSAVTAMKAGACDYILRPFEVETVELAVQRALNVVQIQRENRFLRAEADRDWDELVGDSPQMAALRALVARVAPVHSSVLIAGETGTGKELVARAIHRQSGRQGLFVAINCAAMPSELLESELFGHVRGAFTGAHRSRTGRFELAEGGTVFLDEVTEMPVEMQAKLLRVLQEGVIERLGESRSTAVDIRVIAATNRDPTQAVGEGRLRQDLLYRLDVLRVDVPPLRARSGDVPLLARYFLRRHAARLGLPAPALGEAVMERLEAYPWPGNVRELENVIERMLVLSGGQAVDVGHLPSQLTLPNAAAPARDGNGDEGLDLPQAVEALERRLIARALERAGDNKARAARLLNISERTLWYKLKKYPEVAARLPSG